MDCRNGELRSGCCQFCEKRAVGAGMKMTILQRWDGWRQGIDRVQITAGCSKLVRQCLHNWVSPIRRFTGNYPESVWEIVATVSRQLSTHYEWSITCFVDHWGTAENDIPCDCLIRTKKELNLFILCGPFYFC